MLGLNQAKSNLSICTFSLSCFNSYHEGFGTDWFGNLIVKYLIIK